MFSKQLTSMPRFLKILLWSSSTLAVLFVQNVNAEIFSDGFESGDLSKTQNGFRWTASRSQPGSGGTSVYDLAPYVSSDNPKTGKYSLKFTFGGSTDSDSWSEERFNLGNMYEDIWYKADIFYDTNYSPRDRDATAHNKGPIFFWSGTYGGTSSDQQMAFETWNTDADRMKLSYNPAPGTNNMGHFWPDPRVLIPDISRDLGKWLEIIIHTKFASSANNDGIIEIWKNGNLVFSKYNLNNHSNIRNGVDQGYVFGWANTGFTETTHIYVDNVVFSDKPIVSGSPPNPPIPQ